MNRSTALFALTTLAFGISSIYLYQGLQLERERADELRDQVNRAELDREIAATRAIEFPVAATVAEPQPPVAVASVTSADKKQGANASKDSAPMSPAQRAAELAYVRLQIEKQYPDLAAALSLKPEEAEQLFDLLARQAMRYREYEMKISSEGQVSDETIAKRRQIVQERQQADVAELTELLGEARVDEFNQYKNSLGARAQMRELGMTLAETEYMLRNDQFESMVPALAAEQQRHWAERQELYDSNVNPTRSNPQDVIRQMDQRQQLIEQSLQRRHEIATRFLDSEQLKRYDEMLERERKRAKVEYDLFVTANEDAAKSN